MGSLFSKSMEDHQFAFLEDKPSVEYIKRSRVLLLTPGFGDISTRIMEVYPEAKLFSNEVSPGGESGTLVEQVEKWMQGVSNVSAELAVVDDSALTTLESVDPYAKLAVTYKFVQLYADKCSCVEFIPLFFGWFFNLEDSRDKLRKQGLGLLENINKKDQFVQEFSKFAVGVAPGAKFDIRSYFSTNTLKVGEVLLHCTAFFTGFNQTKENTDYNRLHSKSLGKAFNLEVIGFLITPRTFGVRLKLNDEELKLWDTGDTQCACSQEMAEWRPSKYSPTNGPGSRAHLTLGVQGEVHAVQTGLDLEAIIKEEVEDQKTHKDDRVTIKLEGIGDARCYGEGAWVVYLDESQYFQALFSNFYEQKD